MDNPNLYDSISNFKIYNKKGKQVPLNEDSYTIGMKHIGQGLLKIKLNDNIYQFTFYAKNKESFINSMLLIWDKVNE